MGDSDEDSSIAMSVPDNKAPVMRLRESVADDVSDDIDGIWLEDCL